MQEQKTILDTANVGISMVVDRKLVWANQKTSDLFQFSKEEMEGQSTRKCYPTQEAYEQFAGEAYAALSLGQKYDTEHKLIRRDGSPVWVHSNGRAVDPNDLSKGAIWVLEDITERKQIEVALLETKENFQRVFENQMIAICIFDVETLQIIDVNSTSTRLYGYSREELLGGMTLPELSGEPEESIKSIRFVSNQTSFHLPLRYHKKKDGTIFPAEIVGETYLRNGRLVMLGLIRDITDRLQIEKELHDSLAEKEVLLREVHHRVKNNMAAITSLLNLQRQAMNDSQGQMLMTELSSRIRAMSLVHEKLYRSASLAKIDFQEYLQVLISHLCTSFGSPSLRCDIQAQDVEMPLDLAVPCGMIVNELITNALKYAFPKERAEQGIEDRIFVSLHDENGVFTLCVADNGVGLPPGFDLNNTATLGLSLVQMLGQHQLGGRYVIDQVGETRFTLTFSLKDGGKPYA